MVCCSFGGHSTPQFLQCTMLPYLTASSHNLYTKSVYFYLQRYDKTPRTTSRSMSEVQHLVWLMSHPICLEINNIMQKFSSVSYSTSYQHKEATPARIERDLKDTKLLLPFLMERNPFSDDPTLRNIATGVTAVDTRLLKQLVLK